jgi:hypothetical protein
MEDGHKLIYDAGGVVPVSDGAAYFGGPGVDDYIDCGAVNLGTSGCSYGGWFWINSTQTDQFATLVGQADYDGDHIEGTILRFNNNNLQISFGDDTNGVDDVAQITNFLTTAGNTNTWKHIYATLSSGTTGSLTSKLYVDGVLQVTDTSVNFEPNHSTVNLTIGKALSLNANDAALLGYASNVSVYTAELTQAQIKSIMWKNYAGLTDSEKTNLVSWWNLDSTVSEDYFTTSETDDSPSTINGMVLDNNDTTFTEVSVTNSDFTSGSGTSITGWTNTAANKWEISGSTIISPNGVSLISQGVLTNNITHKAVVRAKNTIPGSTSRLKVYFGANNNAQYELTDDFQEYAFHGYQDNDTAFYLYNESGSASTNVTIDWVKLYKYDGNVGVLV